MRTAVTRVARPGLLVIVLAVLVACSSDEPGASASPSEVASPASVAADPSGTATATPTAAASPSGGAASDAIVIGRRQEHRITQAGASVSIECDGGGEVYVLADDVVATITGSCSDLDVERAGASIDAAAVNEIDINGTGNEVSATDVGELDVTGNQNTVYVDSVNDIDVEGDDNIVTFGSGSPAIDDEGSRNSIGPR